MRRTRLVLSASLVLAGCPSDPAFVDADSAADSQATDSTTRDDTSAPDTMAPDTYDDAFDDTHDDTALDDTADTSARDTSEATEVSFDIVDVVDPDIEATAVCGPGRYDTPCACIRLDCTAAVPGEAVVDATLLVRNSVWPIVALAHPSGASRALDLAEFTDQWRTIADVAKQYGAPLASTSDHDGFHVVLYRNNLGKTVAGWQNNSGTYDPIAVADTCAQASMRYDPTSAEVVVMCTDATADVVLYRASSRTSGFARGPSSPLTLAAASPSLASAWSIAPSGALWVVTAVPAEARDWAVTVHRYASSWDHHPLASVVAPAGATRLAVAVANDTSGEPHVFVVNDLSGTLTLTHYYDAGDDWTGESLTTALTLTDTTRLEAVTGHDDVVYLLVAADSLELHAVASGEVVTRTAALTPDNVVLLTQLTVEQQAPWVLMVDASRHARLWRPLVP